MKGNHLLTKKNALVTRFQGVLRSYYNAYENILLIFCYSKVAFKVIISIEFIMDVFIYLARNRLT